MGEQTKQISRVGIISKAGRPEPVEILKEILPWLRNRKYSVYIDKETASKLNIKGYQRGEIPDLIDVLIVLGGDGTMLSAARLVAEKGIPILGINLGGLGFITEVNRSEVFSAMETMLKGECSVEERMMLEADIIRHGETIGSYTVLNDVVITKGALARIIDLETFIDHTYVTTYKADGLIISTPTGSTAYNLSAGGPIIHPSLNCIVITPICPHTLTNRPIVVSEGSLIEISMLSESEDVFLTLDGQVGFSLKKSDIVEVKKSPHKTRLLIPCERDYFKILREKLKWGER
ncbi:MAG TPA: NAD(+) kinase [Nitrospirae bacterium]|nr:NAD(+) kinase [Nitrospirota bacterium]